VKVVAPDDATVVRRATWNGGPVLDAVVKGRSTTPNALTRRFDVDLSLGKVKVVVRGATDKRTGSDVVRVVAARGSVVSARVPGVSF
jgi:hypothetical protein